jgi:uncharacterized membrane protein YfcA
LIDLPDFATFSAVINDKRMVVAIAVSVLSGLTRGFSGFGSALVYIPLISSIYDPKLAVATLVLIDFVSGAPFAIQALPNCKWREITPITISSLFAIPFGTSILFYFDPVAVRWLVTIVALTLLLVIAAGWRYHNRPKLRVTVFVGVVCGILGGAFQMDGPPAAIYWLGGPNVGSIVRANLMMFIELSGAAICVSYLVSGLLTTTTITVAILVGFPFILSMKLGERLFHGTSEQIYRYVAYAVIALSLLISLPVFDGFLR